MRFKVILFSLVLSHMCIYGQNSVNAISDRVYRQQVKVKPKNLDLIEKFKEVRKREELKIELNGKSLDSLYILEAFNASDGFIYGKIWNNSFDINYEFYNDEFTFIDECTFTDYTCGLIEKWDLDAIYKEEKINSTIVAPLTIYGSFIRCKKRKIKVECIKFKEFFELERDK